MKISSSKSVVSRLTRCGQYHKHGKYLVFKYIILILALKTCNLYGYVFAKNLLFVGYSKKKKCLHNENLETLYHVVPDIAFDCLCHAHLKEP